MEKKICCGCGCEFVPDDEEQTHCWDCMEEIEYEDDENEDDE